MVSSLCTRPSSKTQGEGRAAVGIPTCADREHVHIGSSVPHCPTQATYVGLPAFYIPPQRHGPCKQCLAIAQVGECPPYHRLAPSSIPISSISLRKKHHSHLTCNQANLAHSKRGSVVSIDDPQGPAQPCPFKSYASNMALKLPGIPTRMHEAIQDARSNSGCARTAS